MGELCGEAEMFDPKKVQPSPNGLSREDALFMAKKAEEAERYEEMILYMKQIVALAKDGNEMAGGDGVEGNGVEERNLISVGYKNIMSQRRTAHRTIAGVLEKAPEEEIPRYEAYKKTVANEVFELIKEVIDDIVTPFVDGKNDTKAASDTEVIVFFKKMEGDYNRYGAEITADKQREEFKEQALKAYKAAQAKADSLPSTTPIRLGLALNFSVFYYEICDKKVDACELAKNAFDTAIDHLDTLSEEAYKDSTLIMQLLKDNLTLWTESNNSDNDDCEITEIED